MTSPLTALLQDFTTLKSSLPQAREILLEKNALLDENNTRSVEVASEILDGIENIQLSLTDFFKEYPSLVSLFEEEFQPLKKFYSRENILGLCFYEGLLFPADGQLTLGGDALPVETEIEEAIDFLEQWALEKADYHNETQRLLKNEKKKVPLDLDIRELNCPCVNCIADFRTKIRESAFSLCNEKIEAKAVWLKENPEVTGDIEKGQNAYFDLKDDLERVVKGLKGVLKKSSRSRLQDQYKKSLDQHYNYPSPLGILRSTDVKKFLSGDLYEMGHPDDFLEAVDYEKFFIGLAHHLWKGERFLKREFEKFVKSILFLKRKDISAGILKEHLGEFWIHSQARTLKRKIVYHSGPTNSGKTYHSIQALSKAAKGCYLAPLRLLAGELYDTLNDMGVKTTLLTGEEVIETPDASHYSSTIEMAKLHEEFDLCVIDEIQMISDPQRGWAWTRALVNVMCPEVHVCGDPSVEDLIGQIAALCGDELVIKRYERMTELKVEPQEIGVDKLQKSDALVVFSRRNALRFKMQLEGIGHKVSIVYGRLSPEVRREQARKFDEGLTDIIVSTDAIAMGMNLPIRRIVFSTLSKFFNSKEHPITPSEIKQIAGRAGRYKRYPVGFVNCLKGVSQGNHKVQAALEGKLKQREQCMVGPDLEIFKHVNLALERASLPTLRLSEFLRLFNTMDFKTPFFCVSLKEMIEITEMVEEADAAQSLSDAEIFGFACAPVNLGLMEHVQFFMGVAQAYSAGLSITNTPIDYSSADIDYLETSIKCVELYQWLSRHFDGKNFQHIEAELLENKKKAIEKLNDLLSARIAPEDIKRRGGPDRFRRGDKKRGNRGRPGERKEGDRKRKGTRRFKKKTSSSTSNAGGGTRKKSPFRKKTRPSGKKS